MGAAVTSGDQPFIAVNGGTEDSTRGLGMFHETSNKVVGDGGDTELLVRTVLESVTAIIHIPQRHVHVQTIGLNGKKYLNILSSHEKHEHW